ncbi:MAG: cysteine hydrolase [Thermodesulfobacteriales bacterium]|jgi:ureidoacrylate peracid hydrolase|nr:MAG: cysteine hydrolase [Thermodesulfobacteriales bacterium]
MQIKPILLVVDMQNGFCGLRGSFDKFGFNIKPYRAIIPKLKKTINYFRSGSTPIYYAKAIREASGLDLLDRVHKILPESRREKLDDMHLCIKDTWDADIIDEIYPKPKDYIVEKRRDSVFQDTEFELWLRSFGADTIIFTGIDSYICVESSARDAFNKGYDVIMLSDCVASREENLHKASLTQIKEAYGWVMTSDELINKIDNQELILSGVETPPVSLVTPEAQP